MIDMKNGSFYRTASGAVTCRVTNGETGFEAVVDGKVRIFDAAGGAVHGGDDIVEEWVPKVGERVRFVRDNPNGGELYGASGDVVTVSGEVCDGTFYGDQVSIIHPGHDWRPSAPVSSLEPLPVAAPAQPAATLKIEAGRYYRTRDGRKVGPMKVWRHGGWHSDESPAPLHGGLWLDDGEPKYEGATDSPQLISEWVDEPTAPVSAQVDAIAEEYGSGKREPRPWGGYSERAEAANDNAQSAITVSISLDTGNMHEELDELIAKLKKVRKLQRQVGLAA